MSNPGARTPDPSDRTTTSSSPSREQPFSLDTPGHGATRKTDYASKPSLYSDLTSSSEKSAASDKKSSKKHRNVIGLLALIIAVVGVATLLLPVSSDIGVFTLGVALLVSLIALIPKRCGKATAISSIALVAAALLATPFLPSIGLGDDSDSSTQGNQESPTDEADPEEAPDSGERGSRENPYALGEVISSLAWDVVVNSVEPISDVDMDAESIFNNPAPEGTEYLVANLTVTYKGADEGDAGDIDLAFVGSDNRVTKDSDQLAIAPEPNLAAIDLYAGGTESGNEVLAAPMGMEGLLRVTLDSDTIVFVSFQ